jgi:hypothetical protein
MEFKQPDWHINLDGSQQVTEGVYVNLCGCCTFATKLILIKN